MTNRQEPRKSITARIARATGRTVRAVAGALIAGSVNVAADEYQRYRYRQDIKRVVKEGVRNARRDR